MNNAIKAIIAGWNIIQQGRQLAQNLSQPQYVSLRDLEWKDSMQYIHIKRSPLSQDPEK